MTVGKSNQNDVIKLIGIPHSKSLKNDNNWIYFERTITRGKLIKLGQNVLKENNVLELKFDKYDKKKIAFSKDKTSNEITQKSFVEKFLNSVKEKMYGNK